MHIPIETFEVDGITVEIWLDEDAENPRTIWEQLGTLTQLSSGYAQPDTHHEQRVIDAWERPTGRRSYGYSKGHLYGGDTELVERYARIYLSAAVVGWYDDPRSSSRVFGFITKDEVEKEGLSEPQATLDAMLAEYGAWCEGEVYGYIVDPGASTEDSCWGFYGPGNEYVKEEATAAAKDIARQKQELLGGQMANDIEDEAEISDLLRIDAA